MTRQPDRCPLSIQGLTVAYGRRIVLQDVALEMEPAEVFGLIGLNGVGKTTMIRTVLGLGQTRGGVDLFGIPHTNPAARRNLAYLPEKFLPARLLTGWEYLSIALSYHRIGLDRIAAEAMAEALDLDPAALPRRTGTYSKGMGQKLGLVATLLSGLPLLILDEPMSGLDPRARVRLKDQIRIYREAGHSIFLSSHILADMEEICDRVGVLHGRRILYDGPPGGLTDRHGGISLERAFLAEIERFEDQHGTGRGVPAAGLRARLPRWLGGSPGESLEVS